MDVDTDGCVDRGTWPCTHLHACSLTRTQARMRTQSHSVTTSKGILGYLTAITLLSLHVVSACTLARHPVTHTAQGSISMATASWKRGNINIVK